MSNANDPAYPVDPQIYMAGGSWEQASLGLSKRERFAMAAMQSILSNPSLIDSVNMKSIEYLVVHSVIAADSVLDELSKEHQ